MSRDERESGPAVTAHAKVGGTPEEMLFFTGPKRTYEAGDAIRSMLEQLESARLPLAAVVEVECTARGDSPPDVHLSAGDIARLAQLKASLTVTTMPETADAAAPGIGDKPEFELVFSLKGEFEPDEASAELGLEPDHAHPASIRQTGSAHRGNAWMLRWGPQESEGFQDAIALLRATLLPRANAIRTFCRARRVEPTVEFIAYFRGTPPRFALTSGDVAAIADLSAGLWYAPYLRRPSGHRQHKSLRY